MAPHSPLRRRSASLLALAVASALLFHPTPSAASAQPAPAAGTARPQASPNTPKRPDPVNFDPAIEVGPAIRSAGTSAESANKRVLVVWGKNGFDRENRMLAVTLGRFHTAKMLAEEFELVFVSIGDEGAGPANREKAEAWGVNLSQEPPPNRRRSGNNAGSNDGFHPTLSVHDTDGSFVATLPLSPLAVRHTDEWQYEGIAVVDWLTQHRAPRQDAMKLLETALEQAKKQRKGVMVWYTQPSDEWCREFEQWLQEPNIKGMLENAFVILKIEVERTDRGFEVLEQHAGKNPEGVPWFAFLGADGKVLAASQTEKEPNIGYPGTDDDIRRVKAMLVQSGAGMSELGLKLIEDSLVARREAIKARHEAARAAAEADPDATGSDESPSADKPAK